MKRLITLIIAVVMIMTLISATPSYAAETGGTYEQRLANNKRVIEQEEASDEYTLNTYTIDWELWGSLRGEVVYDKEKMAIVQEVTAGLTDDYERAKAIAEWFFRNSTNTLRYTQADIERLHESYPDIITGACGKLASELSAYLRVAGFPAKKVGGSSYSFGEWGPHEWNHVYIDNRWVYVDPSWREFDKPVEHWSGDHWLSGGHTMLPPWDGTITILDSSNHQVVQTLGPIPLGTPLGDIPELSLTNLYADKESNFPIQSHFPFDSLFSRLWTKTHRVAFNIQLDNEYKSVVSHVVDEKDGNLNSVINVPDGAPFPDVKLPVKSGYTFIGWQELYEDIGPLWNAGSGKVTEDMTMIAVFQKGTVTKPTNPVKPVNNNNAKPTASKVLVNGSSVEFDAYNINNNNYFKLRDLAQAVNNTDKNFEVTWDGANNAINLISNKAYTPAGGELVKGDGKAKAATPNTSKIFKDGKEVSLTAYNINGNNYFKLRDIAKAFDIGVTWDSKTNTVGIDTSTSIQNKGGNHHEKDI